MVKTLISLISNIKVKGGRGEIKNTSMDKKKGLCSEKRREARDVGSDVSKHARLNSKLQKRKLEKVSSD